MSAEAAIPERTHYKERIVAILRAGPESISGIARKLSVDREKPIHRLTVAGYLGAMAEAGMLKEIDRPPSKLYLLQEPEAHKSLHQRVWRAVQEIPGPIARPALAVAVLQRLLERPVFVAELRHAGMGGEGLHMERMVLPDEERRAYRRALSRHPGQRIEIPSRDPIVGLANDDPLHSHPAVEETIRRVILHATGAEHLRGFRDGASQSHLRLEGEL